jgi:hypothetical protein
MVMGVQLCEYTKKHIAHFMKGKFYGYARCLFCYKNRREACKGENYQNRKDKGEPVQGVNSSMVYLIYCENLCKCYNVPPPGTTIKEKINI